MSLLDFVDKTSVHHFFRDCFQFLLSVKFLVFLVSDFFPIKNLQIFLLFRIRGTFFHPNFIFGS